MPLRVSWSAACARAVWWELWFLGWSKHCRRGTKKGVNKKGLLGMFSEGIKIGIGIGIERVVGKIPTPLQLHRTGRTISDDVALRTPDFDARTRAAGVTCRSAGRTGYCFLPKSIKPRPKYTFIYINNETKTFWTSLSCFQRGMVCEW